MQRWSVNSTQITTMQVLAAHTPFLANWDEGRDTYHGIYKDHPYSSRYSHELFMRMNELRTVRVTNPPIQDHLTCFNLINILASCTAWSLKAHLQITLLDIQIDLWTKNTNAQVALLLGLCVSLSPHFCLLSIQEVHSPACHLKLALLQLLWAMQRYQLSHLGSTTWCSMHTVPDPDYFIAHQHISCSHNLFVHLWPPSAHTMSTFMRQGTYSFTHSSWGRCMHTCKTGLP